MPDQGYLSVVIVSRRSGSRRIPLEVPANLKMAPLGPAQSRNLPDGYETNAMRTRQKFPFEVQATTINPTNAGKMKIRKRLQYLYIRQVFDYVKGDEANYLG
jgi:hypothetical protein